MNNITPDEPPNNDDTPLTRTQVEELFRELEEQRAREREIQANGVELPLAIREALENTPTAQLKDELRKYKKYIQRYNHPDWTSVQQINKEYFPDLKNWKVNAYQLVNTIYKNTETTRIQARANTELYEQLKYLQEKAKFASTKYREIFNNTVEQAERLAVFGFGSAKFQEHEAKEVSFKALKLPPNAKHLEYSVEEDGKTNAFDRDFVEQLQKARFEDKITRNATSVVFKVIRDIKTLE
ncbi:hypothetical protein K501DRAFT_184946 [Backusella circina FSU 941]|nr:hypothetical protein K501DRAFT_184946 [Backusella circina FSU 941]